MGLVCVNKVGRCLWTKEGCVDGWVGAGWVVERKARGVDGYAGKQAGEAWVSDEEQRQRGAHASGQRPYSGGNQASIGTGSRSRRFHVPKQNRPPS